VQQALRRARVQYRTYSVQVRALDSDLWLAPPKWARTGWLDALQIVDDHPGMVLRIVDDWTSEAVPHEELSYA
jgi:hypothetical protein